MNDDNQTMNDPAADSEDEDIILSELSDAELVEQAL